MISLKSGTDIRGIASEGVDGEHINLTDDVIKKITVAFVKWLSNYTSKPESSLVISIGHDSRISAERIKAAAISAMGGIGKTYDAGLASTPAMFMSVIDLDCDGAVQITASHHPFNRNGLKFFTKNGGLNENDIEDILHLAEKIDDVSDKCGNIEKIDYMSDYAARLRKLICDGLGKSEADKPLSGVKIAVDASNGAGGFYAEKVLHELGADISGSRYLEPDGMFPNHVPNPEDASAMESISEAVLKSGADFGVIFDTDVDRAACVDSKGMPINRNRLVALAAAIALEQCPGGTIVTDSTTSAGLKLFIEDTLKGKHHRYRRGYRNVINEAIKLNESGENCPLAIETSGHAAFKNNYFLDDGAYLITLIIVKMMQLRSEGRSLDDLIEALEEPEEEAVYRFDIIYSDFRSYGQKVISLLMDFADKNPRCRMAQDNYEGVRVYCSADERDWFLLRLSVHDPVLSLNIESAHKGGVAKIKKLLKPFFLNFSGLNISSLCYEAE